jgi:hypothetical protein
MGFMHFCIVVVIIMALAIMQLSLPPPSSLSPPAPQERTRVGGDVADDALQVGELGQGCSDLEGGGEWRCMMMLTGM